MNLYLDVQQKDLVQDSLSSTVLIPYQPTFYSNNVPEIVMYMLQPNPSGGTTTPYVAYNPYNYTSNLTMSVSIGFAVNGTSSLQVDEQRFMYNTNDNYFSCSMNLTGSIIQNIQLAGSQSYLEVQESGILYGQPYTVTWLQRAITLTPSLA